MSDKLNYSSLKQARRARKLSVTEVADFTKISESRLAKFEAGELDPSFKQLARLGELYNTPLYVFYRDIPPQFEDTLPDFRKSHPTAADLSPRGLTRLWQVEGRAKFVDDLAKALGRNAPKTTNLRRLTNKSVPEPAELRAGFDKWLGERGRALKFSGTPEDIFIRHLRLFIETRACLTAVNSAPVDDYLGFYQSFSNSSHVIFINSEIKHEKRRLFTLGHEVAHFLYEEEGVSNPFVAKNSIERKCNAFAAEFLAPDSQVMNVVHSAITAIAKDISRLVNLVSRETLLSRQAATLRLRELGVISHKDASTFFAHLSRLRRISEPGAAPSINKPMGRSVVVGKKLSEVGVYAAYTASLALKAKMIDLVDIERGLGISENLQKDVLDLAARRFEASAD